MVLPELPEVELVRRSVKASALGRRIASAMVLDTGVLEDVTAEELEGALTGQALTGAARHGKQLFLQVGQGRWLTVHLGMTGGVQVLEDRQDLPRFTRVRLDFDDGGSLVYEDMRKFGAIGLTPSMSAFLERKRLGPDALEIERDDFVERVARHRRPIKTVLLDQSVLAGVGNLYSDEALFQCGVHPMALADELGEDRLDCIHRNIVSIMDRSIKVGTDFDSFPEGYMLKARHPTSHCPKGHGPWHTMKVNARTAYFCPRCQRL
jgi:formamidopyrimidine-DNA glycosylase